jgi:hypothetical protein
LGAVDATELAVDAVLVSGGLAGVFVGGFDVPLSCDGLLGVAVPLSSDGLLGVAVPLGAIDGALLVQAGVEGNVLTVPLGVLVPLDIVRTVPERVFSSVFILSQKVPRASYPSPRAFFCSAAWSLS